MLSNKPYLMRAFYDWIIDSACTPILVLDATNPRCKVPADFIEGNEIVFNVSPIAIRDFKISNDAVEFKASFNGVIHIISAPIKAVLAIYAEENGEGLFFDAEDDEADGIPEGVVQLRGIEGSRTVDVDADNDELSTQQMVPPRGESSAAKAKPFLKLVE